MTFKLVRVKSMPKDYLPSKKQLASSYQFFCEFLRHRMGFGHSPYPIYKHRILQEMDDATRNGETDILIMEPRSHGKTTVDVIPYLPWRWLTEPHLRGGVFSAGEKHSKKITSGIIKIIEMLAPYGYYELAERPKKQELKLVHDRPYIDPSLECYPIQGSGSVGSGKDVIICDDVYTTENANSETKAGDIEDRYDRLTDLWRETQNPLRITIGTPLCHGDLYDQIMHCKDGKWQHKILWFPIVPQERLHLLPPAPITKEQAEAIRHLFIWPEVLSVGKIQSFYNSPGRWTSQYMLRPASEATPTFLRENITLLNQPARPDMFAPGALMIVIDPASGQQSRGRGDNCAIIVGGVDKQGTWRIVDGWFSNAFVIEDAANAWRDLVIKWQCVNTKTGRLFYPRTSVEAGGMQSLFRIPLSTVSKEAPIYGHAAIDLHTTGNVKKDIRIEGCLSPIISRRRLVIHASPVQTQLFTELVKFPGYPQRDVADATAALIHRLVTVDPYWRDLLKQESPVVFDRASAG